MDLAKLYFDLKNIIWLFNNNKPNNKKHNNNIDIISEYSTFAKNIYLTIDDIINDDSFEEILDMLDEFNANATFFVISSNVSEQNKYLLSRAVKSGHHLANHGQTNCKHFLCSYSKLYN